MLAPVYRARVHGMSALESGAISKTPLYHQVYSLLLERIKAGEWQVGTFLPNEYRLATEYGVSIGTIRSAVSLLAREGVVVRQQGRGTLVVDTRERNLAHQLNRIRRCGDGEVRVLNTTILSQDIRTCDHELAAALNLDAGEDVHRITRLSVLEDTGILHDTIYLPVKLYKDMADPENYRRSVANLAVRNNLLVDKVEERITAIKCPPELADLLEVETQEPVLRIERTLYTASAAPIELRVTHCRLMDAFYTLDARLP